MGSLPFLRDAECFPRLRDKVAVIISSLDTFMVVGTLMLSFGFGLVVAEPIYLPQLGTETTSHHVLRSLSVL